MDGLALRHHFYPESNIGGFSRVDIAVAFYLQINAALRPEHRLLDFGAGRGEHIVDDTNEFRRYLFNFQGRCAHVEGCDVDSAVLANPYLDHATVLKANSPLPYDDNTFDIVYARYVFEHIQDSEFIANELKRVLKPGGLIAALTPNRYGYVALAATLVPNRLHVKALTKIQPNRKAADVFPTAYELNSPKAIRRAFGQDVDAYVSFVSGEPAYHFSKMPLYRIFTWLHKLLPARLQPFLIIYIRKNG